MCHEDLVVIVQYIKKHPKAKPFRNSRWTYFNKVTLIMLAAPAGAHVFHPTARASTPDDVGDNPSSPEPTPPPVSSDPQDGEDSGHDEVSNCFFFFHCTCLKFHSPSLLFLQTCMQAYHPCLSCSQVFSGITQCCCSAEHVCITGWLQH